MGYHARIQPSARLWTGSLYERDFLSLEDAGYQKPMKEYFDYICTHSRFSPKKTLIVGDSLSSDIQGGTMPESIPVGIARRVERFLRGVRVIITIHRLDALKDLIDEGPHKAGLFFRNGL